MLLSTHLSKDEQTALADMYNAYRRLQGAHPAIVVRLFGPYCLDCEEKLGEQNKEYRFGANGDAQLPDTNCLRCREITNDRPVAEADEKRLLAYADRNGGAEALLRMLVLTHSPGKEERGIV